MIWLRKTYWLLFLASSTVYAQNNQKQLIDSLQKVLESNISVLEKSDIYSELSLSYSGFDSLKAYEFAQKSYKSAQQGNDDYGLSKAYFTLAGFHLDYDQPKKAQAYYLQAKTLIESLIKKDSTTKYLKLWVRSTFNISVSLSNQGLNEEAMAYIQEMIPVAEKLKFFKILGRVNSNLGIQFLNLGQNTKAYEYFMKSGPYYKITGDYEALTYDRLVFASCLREMDSLPTMKTVLEEVRSYLDKSTEASTWSMYYLVYGEFQASIKQYKEAIKNYDISYQLIQKSKIYGRLDQLYLCYSEVYKALKDSDNTKKYLQLYLDRTRKNNNGLRELDILKELAVIEQEEGNFEVANQFLLEFMRKEDSINASEVVNRINQLEIQYESEKKEREILQLKNQNNASALALEKNRSQRYILLFTTASLLSFLVIGYFIYRSRQRNQRLKTQLGEQQIQQLKHNQRNKVHEAMLAGQENERQRLAADLHDGMAGRLSATSIRLWQISKDDQASGNSKESLINAAISIDNALDELRNIARNLTPESLFKHGLKAAIEDYCVGIKGNNNHINFVIQWYDTEVKIPDKIALTIYRIIQELINNTIKHAKANEILIQYTVNERKISITVEDDGIGFDASQNENPLGMGLNNIRTRVEYLKGTIEFDSIENSGTNVHIEIKY